MALRRVLRSPLPYLRPVSAPCLHTGTTRLADSGSNIFNEHRFADRAPAVTDAEKMKEKDRTVGPERYVGLAGLFILFAGLLYERRKPAAGNPGKSSSERPPV